MAQSIDIAERRTSVDVVFDHLYNEIVTLGLLPGAKMSEVEIANRFGVSRQPVRDAFSRLGNLDLLLIRPQKATVVRKFSSQSIKSARFTRSAVEIEVLHSACKKRNPGCDVLIEKNLAKQKQVIVGNEPEKFHDLDYEFHRLLCVYADCEFAFQTIAENKAKVDRLCMLSLGEKRDMSVLYDDHVEIFDALKKGDEVRLQARIRIHFERLDSTVEAIKDLHAEYFED